MGAPALKRISFEEYVALEELSDVRHEWLDGEMFAMSGGTIEHSALIASVTMLLASALRGRPCVVLESNARTRVPATGLGTYPDVSVVCGRLRRDAADRNTLINPCLLVEVVSPSTESWDRGAKFRHYQQIPSLVEYLLVSQDPRVVELYRRQPDGRWLYEAAIPGAALELASVGVTLQVSEVFAVLDELTALRDDPRDDPGAAG